MVKQYPCEDDIQLKKILSQFKLDSPRIDIYVNTFRWTKENEHFDPEQFQHWIFKILPPNRALLVFQMCTQDGLAPYFCELSNTLDPHVHLVGAGRQIVRLDINSQNLKIEKPFHVLQVKDDFSDPKIIRDIQLELDIYLVTSQVICLVN